MKDQRTERLAFLEAKSLFQLSSEERRERKQLQRWKRRRFRNKWQVGSIYSIKVIPESSGLKPQTKGFRPPRQRWDTQTRTQRCQAVVGRNVNQASAERDARASEKRMRQWQHSKYNPNAARQNKKRKSQARY
jgi:hypothetical protein